MSLPEQAFWFMWGILGAAVFGIGVAWWMHRRTTLSAWNLYLAWMLTVPAAVTVARSGGRPAAAAIVVIAFVTGAAAAARRWRLGSLGAGGELRQYERSRRMVWRRRPATPGRRTRIEGQGELVRDRAWPKDVAALPMTGDGRGPIPLGEGHHLFFVGATGSGKTTSARRWLLARGLSRDTITGLVVLDPKGDCALERDLRAIAAATGRPFVLFDPYDPTTDRWNPIWADDPGAVVARLVAPVEADSDSDASHYSRVLRAHLGLVAEALHVAGRWPVTLPVLLRCAQRHRFDQIANLAASREDGSFRDRLEDHHLALESRATQNQLDGSLRALEVVAGLSWRPVLTPDPSRGAVTLPSAMAAGAVVLFKTHVEDIREEAETITTLALADIAAAALTLPAGIEWALLIDEFGSVLQGRAATRAIALMQRARSAHGQIAVSTQSVADIAAATGNEQLLPALADNFTGFVLHRQTSPESRDWLAMLLGTRELWQSTDRTGGLGARTDGSGSRRRAAEFVVRPDDFKQLDRGEAIVWTTLGPQPAHVRVIPGPTLDQGPVDGRGVYQPVRLDSLDAVLDGATTPARSNGRGPAADLFGDPEGEP